MNPSRQQRTLFIVLGIAIVAVVAAGGAIFISSNRPIGPARDYSTIPQSRTEDGGFVLGSPDAPITIVAFEDFTCPHCQDYEETVHRFIDEYVVTGKARFEYRMYPIVHPTYAIYTAQIAECADELQPGSFWAAHDSIFGLASANRYEGIAREVANQLNLSYSDLLDCARQADQFETDQRLAQRLGVGGTPAVMVRYGDETPSWITYNGRTYDRGAVPFEVLAAVVESAQ